MVNDLLQQLTAKPQRETSGSDTASRFDYQKNWAFCQMLRRHMEGADYLVAFEFHDDVVFLEKSAQVEKADFCQVKTARNATTKTLGSLLARKGETSSILGKLYTNFDGICPDHDCRVMLVSNVSFNFSGSDICADDLEPKYREKLVEKLQEEFPSLDQNRLSKMHFIVTGVSLDAMQSYLNGEVAELFRHVAGEDHGVNIHSWIRLVQSEISRKNNALSSDIKTPQELESKKCISKDFVTKSINLVISSKREAPELSLIFDELKTTGWTSTDLVRIGKKIPQATSDFYDATNLEALSISTQILNLFQSQESEDLNQLLIRVGENISDISNGIDVYSNRYYLWALTILVYHENI